jgi:hypothetical protein
MNSPLLGCSEALEPEQEHVWRFVFCIVFLLRAHLDEGRKTQVDVNNITFYEHSETDELQGRVGIRGEDDPRSHLPKLPVDATAGRTLGKLKKDAIDATFDF